jgi:hypothetical protein
VSGFCSMFSQLLKLQSDQFAGEFGQSLVLALGPSGLHGDVLPLDVTQIPQSLSDGLEFETPWSPGI